MRGIQIEDGMTGIIDRDLAARLLADPVRDVRSFVREMLKCDPYLNNGRLRRSQVLARLRRRHQSRNGKLSNYWSAARVDTTIAAIRRRAESPVEPQPARPVDVGLKCPKCGGNEFRTKDTRPQIGYVRRIRLCCYCQNPIITAERSVLKTPCYP